MNLPDYEKSSDMNIDTMHDGEMSEIIHHPPRSVAELNALNHLVWGQRAEWLDDKLEDEYLCLMANNDLISESTRKPEIPFHSRLSFEGALKKAEPTRDLLFRAFAHRGGKADKPDALQIVILEIVSEHPNIHSRDLLHLLRKFARESHAVVRKVDQTSTLLGDQKEQIHFMDNRKRLTSPVSGLKDRLCRARKKIKSR